MAEYRVIRVPLPVALLRELDEIIVSGTGGFETRADFVREAVEAQVAELKYGLADPAPEPHAVASAAGEADQHGTMAVQHAAVHGDGGPISASSLGGVPDSVLVDSGIAEVADEYLFGLHNRDYPTLWAARRLADMTRSELVPADDFYRQVADEAWSFAERLQAAESDAGQKLTALFPTNRAKPESSESAFLTFAVGSHSDGDVLHAHGPLYVWRLAQLVRTNGTVVVGLTPEAREVLDALAELSVEAPHPPELARIFFNYLRAHAPTDWAGFGETLRIVATGGRRLDLVRAMNAEHPEWTETVAATNAAGYIARSREWGLIAPRQVEGRYELTDFGRDLMSTHWGGNE